MKATLRITTTMMNSGLSGELLRRQGTLRRMMDSARQIVRENVRKMPRVEVKEDASPVTVIDRAVELALRSHVREDFPSDGIFGEEGGYEPGREQGDDHQRGRWNWVIDPIDGTKSLITGKPLFGTLIAVVEDGEVILGGVEMPVLGERWIGARGAKTEFERESSYADELNLTVVETRRCPRLEDAYLYATTPYMFDGSLGVAFDKLRQQVRYPLFGCDCYAYGLLASGRCDLVVEASLAAYDYLAMVPIVEGAGGIITDWQGMPLRWKPPDGVGGDKDMRLPREVVAAGDPELHRIALNTISKHISPEDFLR